MALEEKSGGHQHSYGSSSDDHERLYQISQIH